MGDYLFQSDVHFCPNDCAIGGAALHFGAWKDSSVPQEQAANRDGVRCPGTGTIFRVSTLGPIQTLSKY